MTVEVTSRDADTNRPDRVEKPDGYAAAGIPVYLLVDREACSVTVFTEPEKGTYRSATTRPFGAVVELAEPVGFALDTEKLKEYAGFEAAWPPRAESGTDIRGRLSHAVVNLPQLLNVDLQGPDRGGERA